MLKEKLLNTELFIDNEYLDKYVELIENNKETEKQKCKTQRHHIIPRVMCKINNYEFVDDDSNLVNLLYKDHILAHYYLCLCVKDEQLKYKMFISMNYMIGNAKTYGNIELNDFKCSLDGYQTLYEEMKVIQGSIMSQQMLGHKTSDETKSKISNSNSGRVYINKDGVVRSVELCDLELFESNGWNKGNPNCQKRNTRKGSVVLNKDNVEIYIEKEFVDEYISNGWSVGRSESHKESTKKSTQKYYDSLTKEQKIEKYASYGMLGKKCSNEHREKISKANKGRKISEEQKLKNSLNKRGTIHMTNGVVDVMIKPEFESEYLQKGFYRGRSKNRKHNK